MCTLERQMSVNQAFAAFLFIKNFDTLTALFTYVLKL